MSLKKAVSERCCKDSKDSGRIYRFPVHFLSVSGCFCVICMKYMLHSPYHKTFDQCNNMVETLDVTYLLYASVSKGWGQNHLVRKHIFSIYYQSTIHVYAYCNLKFWVYNFFAQITGTSSL